VQRAGVEEADQARSEHRHLVAVHGYERSFLDGDGRREYGRTCLNVYTG
jgi:hypothetical protein